MLPFSYSDEMAKHIKFIVVCSIFKFQDAEQMKVIGGLYRNALFSDLFLSHRQYVRFGRRIAVYKLNFSFVWNTCYFASGLTRVLIDKIFQLIILFNNKLRLID